MKSLRRQQGLSMINVFLIITLVIFFATLFAKLGPIYSDHFYLDSISQEIAAEIGSKGRSISEIREQMSKNLRINNVKFDVKNGLKRDKKSGQLVLEYETRVHVLFNVDAVVTFKKEYSLQP